MALGADAGAVRRLVMAQGLRVVGAGVLIGTVAALAAGRAIASLLYGVTPHDPLVLSVVIVILGAVAAGSGYLPPPRAARGGPVGALRGEEGLPPRRPPPFREGGRREVPPPPREGG